MKANTLIFTATYNEADNIINFIQEIELLNLDLDLLIIDDNSPDNTSLIIRKYIPKKIKINLIKRDKKLGLDTAHKLAYNYALNKSYKYLITMDADMSHSPKEIINFLKNLNTHKFVIGSRYIKGGSCNMNGLRLFLSVYGNKFIKFIFRINCNEFTTSYRGFDLTSLNNFNLNMIKSKGYSFFMETLYLLHKKNIFIKEIPISFLDRTKGTSKIPKNEIFRTLFNLFKLKLLS
jgi:dolichol-phosphate mannosyltransferase